MSNLPKRYSKTATTLHWLVAVMVFIFSSHPPLADRIKALESSEK